MKEREKKYNGEFYKINNGIRKFYFRRYYKQRK